MVPVPETLMSPDVCPASVAQKVTVSAINTQIQQTKINKNKGNEPIHKSKEKRRQIKIIKMLFSFELYFENYYSFLIDNRLNSPKMRSPHLKRSTAERSPTISPRKTNMNTSTQNTAQHQQSNTKSIGNQQPSHVIEHQMKSRQFISNSMHVAAPDDCFGGGSSDEDSDNINVDKLKTIRNKAAQR